MYNEMDRLGNMTKKLSFYEKKIFFKNILNIFFLIFFKLFFSRAMPGTLGRYYYILYY